MKTFIVLYWHYSDFTGESTQRFKLVWGITEEDALEDFEYEFGIVCGIAEVIETI